MILLYLNNLYATEAFFNPPEAAIGFAVFLISMAAIFVVFGVVVEYDFAVGCGFAFSVVNVPEADV